MMELVGKKLTGVSEADYHADPSGGVALSASMAKILLEQSPLHAWAHHPKLGNRVERKPTAALDRGSLVHALLLGTGAELEVIDAANYKTKKAQQARDAAREARKLPVLTGDLEDATKAADAIRARLEELEDPPGSGSKRPVRFDGESEVTVIWHESSVHGPVLCKARLDHLPGTPGVIFDLKTTGRSAAPDKLGRAAMDYGYAIQRAAYVSALRRLHPELAGRIEMTFVVVETEEPYAVTAGRLDGPLQRLGESLWEQAVHRWSCCLAADSWPGYGWARIEAPPWLAAQMQRGEA